MHLSHADVALKGETTQQVLVRLSLARASVFCGLAFLHRACVQNRIATKYVIGERFNL